jgi:uncharacterized RDD family membrane protein YckC
VLFVFYIIYILANEVSGGHYVLELGKRGFLILGTVLFFGSEWLYFTVFEMIWNGQTPGKRALRLRVIKEDGSPVSALEVLARNATRPLDTTGPMALVGLALIFFQPHGQRLGDWLARTMVIRETPIDWSLFAVADEENKEGSRGVVRLQPLEFEVLQRYLQRKETMDAASRETVAAQLQAWLQTRVSGINMVVATDSPSEWLEALAKRL